MLQSRVEALCHRHRGTTLNCPLLFQAQARRPRCSPPGLPTGAGADDEGKKGHFSQGPGTRGPVPKIVDRCSRHRVFNDPLSLLRGLGCPVCPSCVPVTPGQADGYLIWNPLIPSGGSACTRTSSPTAERGPWCDHSPGREPSPADPSKTASTLPSGRFRTQPVTPCRSASLRHVSRKNTPCTRPEI